MKQKMLIVGLVLVLGLVFERLVIAKTPDGATKISTNALIKGDKVGTNALPEEMVGFFTIQDQLYFRDANGHIGSAEEDQSMSFSRMRMPTTYTITWENDMVSEYSPGFQLKKVEQAEEDYTMLVRMPEQTEEAAPILEEEAPEVAPVEIQPSFEEVHGTDW